MEFITKEVPADIRFISDWEDFKFSNFPKKCIINKQIPGCGFTEYCLNGDEPIVLCSPRKMLMQNKFNQHKEDVYLVKNEMDKETNTDKDLDSKKPKPEFDKELSMSKSEVQKVLEERAKKNSEIYERLKNEISSYVYKRHREKRPIKILVTYDSYRIVKKILEDYGQEFYTIIDEFQSILHDARFKSDTEMQFMDNLTNSETSIFVSATPMLEDYMKELDEFKDLPYYTLDWAKLNPSRVVQPDLIIKTMKTVKTKAEEVIKSYLDGNFESVIVQRDRIPTEIVSKEAVLYVNSVKHIYGIIKKCGLKPEQVNILCSNTEDNLKAIQKALGKKFTIGDVPLKGESHKMFTFCTRTVYLGADFYSTCARSFIFSDSNIDSLAVDISEDLPQILGRQRLDENPWKNSANFYYRTTCDYRKIAKEEFDSRLKEKMDVTKSLMRTYGNITVGYDKKNLAQKYQKDAKNSNYKDDYVAVNKRYDDEGNIYLDPKFNQLVYINELRAFNIQQIDYKDRFTVFSKITNKLTSDDIINNEVSEFLKHYQSITIKKERLKMLCGLNEVDETGEVINSVINQLQDSDKLKSYYINLGPQRIKELGYNSTLIEKELGIVIFSPELLQEKIYSEFNEGDKILLSDAKNRLTEIYSLINYKKTPKAKDLEEFFEVKNIVSYEKKADGGRKQIKGYELIKKLK